MPTTVGWPRSVSVGAAITCHACLWLAYNCYDNQLKAVRCGWRSGRERSLLSLEASWTATCSSAGDSLGAGASGDFAWWPVSCRMEAALAGRRGGDRSRMPVTSSVPQRSPVGGGLLRLGTAARFLVVARFGSRVFGAFGRKPCLGFGYGRQW